jgi:hypothetical protein
MQFKTGLICGTMTFEHETQDIKIFPAELEIESNPRHCMHARELSPGAILIPFLWWRRGSC